MTAPTRSENPARLAAHLRRRARWRWPEILFWLAIAVGDIRCALARGPDQ